ncbi:hypothetical protein HZ326_5179 [Fusarium oxysporum f. sp. albedinis]|jgi:hypothetical protein|nr:hypothetical protein HZ326_5179 [Fusarium oxysporum f. sp. albedinis]
MVSGQWSVVSSRVELHAAAAAVAAGKRRGRRPAYWMPIEWYFGNDFHGTVDLASDPVSRWCLTLPHRSPCP